MKEGRKILYIVIDRDIFIIYWLFEGVDAMKKKINMTIEEDLHLRMKEIALKRKIYLYDLYEEAIDEFIKKTDNQKTLDEKYWKWWIKSNIIKKTVLRIMRRAILIIQIRILILILNLSVYNILLCQKSGNIMS